VSRMPSEPPGENETRAGFAHFEKLPTRWGDNDLYGHVNNAVYYSYFDTVINRYLIERCGLDIVAGPVIGLAVETGCRFHRSLAFPDLLDAGLRVAHLGTSSVRYEVGLFVEGSDALAALGRFVHVFVDRAARRPVPLPAEIRAGLERLRRGAGVGVDRPKG
jgi:acyl-CoA thioester hydrolase